MTHGLLHVDALLLLLLGELCSPRCATLLRGSEGRIAREKVGEIATEAPFTPAGSRVRGGL
jgi:hypothetical protein